MTIVIVIVDLIIITVIELNVIGVVDVGIILFSFDICALDVKLIWNFFLVFSIMSFDI